MATATLSELLNIEDSGSLRLERSLLKDRATEMLRAYIFAGRIPPGTKLTERDVAELLGTSRIPARDALLALEEQGLLVSTAHGRCVLQPTERDIRELYQVRTSLERLAAQLAARNTSEQHRAELQAELDEMERASVEADTQRFTESDLRFHALMWRQADNNHLIAALTRLIGPMYLFIGFNVTHFSWVDTLELHRDLVRRLSNGDEDGAAENIERHLKLACMKTLEAFDTHHKQPRR